VDEHCEIADLLRHCVSDDGNRRRDAELRAGKERGRDHDAVAKVVHAGANEDHEPRASLVCAAVHMQRMRVFGFLRIVDVVIVSVGVAPQHKLLQQEKSEKTDQHGNHYTLRAAFLERMRQQLEENGAEQRADGERDESRDPRGMERQRAGGRGCRENPAGERSHDNFSEDSHGCRMDAVRGTGYAAARGGLYVPARRVRRKPGERRHATGIAVAPPRVETHCIGHRAESALMRGARSAD
jgi:hypothetical protein